MQQITSLVTTRMGTANLNYRQHKKNVANDGP